MDDNSYGTSIIIIIIINEIHRVGRQALVTYQYNHWRPLGRTTNSYGTSIIIITNEIHRVGQCIGAKKKAKIKTNKTNKSLQEVKRTINS